MFCNPPYGRAIADWVRKSYEESRKPGTTVVMLIPSRTDTAYFHDWIFGKASEVRFLRGRLKFTDEDGNGEGRGGAPAFKLVAADGGLWKSQAVDNVKNYLVKALADVPDREKITIIA